MIAAAIAPRARREASRMLVVHARQKTFCDAVVTDLPDHLQPGDLLIVNDSATLPASLVATLPAGSPVEIRLLHYLGGSDWKAVLFGAGDWRTPTERRDPPEHVPAGCVLRFGDSFTAEVVAADDETGRVMTIRFSKQGVDMWTALYAYGRPIQYAYLKSDIALWSVQTTYASRPWSAEMPSAGYSLTWRILLDLKKREIGLASLTHAAGISSIGDEELDARLPFRERFEIPQATIDAIAAARLRGGRVIAVGTTVVRALEGCSAQHGGPLVSGAGETDLVIGSAFRPAIVDGILTGVHDPAQSHFRLLRAFADEATLRRAWRHATEQGYLCHEFGDVCLILP